MTFAGNNRLERWFWSALASSALAGCQGRDAFLGGLPDDRCTEHCFIDPGAPVDAPSRFSAGPSRATAPAVIYPLADSVHPLSLPELTVHFRRGDPGLELFRLRFIAAGKSHTLYAPCLAVAEDGCRYTLPDAFWDELRAAFRGRRVALEVTGADADGHIATAAALEFSLTESVPENAGFYFWSATPTFSGTFRVVLGARRALPFVVSESPDDAEQACVGCHSVSRDGTTIAYTIRGSAADALDQRSGHLIVSTTASPTTRLVTPSERYDSSMMALTSDGRRVLVAYDHRLVLRTTADDAALGLRAGDVISEVPESLFGARGRGYFPEFSRDDQLALSVSAEPDSPHAVRSGSIALLGYDRQTHAFGPLRILVPGNDEEFHYYPTWSPDSRFLAFVSAPRAAGQSSYDQRLSRLRLVRVEDGAVVDLGRASGAPGSWSTLPKFAPFDPAEHGGLLFLTFNTKADYGLLLRNSAIAAGEYKIPQLWLSTIDPTRLPEDPSSPPVWLPFQDFTQRSHLGFWTEHVFCRLDVPAPVRCAPGERCENGVCLTEPR